MIVDSSVLVAILTKEADWRRYAEALHQAGNSRISAANYVELAIVVDSRRDPVASRLLDDFLQDAGIAIAAVSEGQARIAREAYRDFGKGRGHPARLNFGDCFAYAFAREAGEPLLFKGGDFSHTGIASALE